MKKKTVTTAKPVKKAVKSAAPDKDGDDLFGFFAGKGTIIGDVVSPAFSPEEWGDLYFSSPPQRRRR
ncbi:MAG: hypothetical protein WA261_06105 [Candidatus Sulfotelmatobacter sp.]|jgi:hypothetical protein